MSPTKDCDLELNNTELIEDTDDKTQSKVTDKGTTVSKKTVGGKKATKKITPIKMDMEKEKGSKKICKICSNIESFSGSYEEVVHEHGHISSKNLRENATKDE